MRSKLRAPLKLTQASTAKPREKSAESGGSVTNSSPSNCSALGAASASTGPASLKMGASPPMVALRVPDESMTVAPAQSSSRR